MRSSKKTILSVTIALIAAISLLLGISFAKADSAELTSADFNLAIAVREVDAEHESGGIRFKVRIEKEKFETLMTDGVLNDKVTTGVLVTSYATARTLGHLTIADAGEKENGVYNLVTTEYWKAVTVGKDEYYESAIAIYSVPPEKSNVKLAVMPYVTVDGVTTYKSKAGEASMADAVIADGDESLVATYIRNYTVAYYDKDGNAITDNKDNPITETVAYGNTIASAAADAPAVTGYTFAGWKNAAGTVAWDFGSEGTKVTGNTKLYAKYTATEYTATINRADGSTDSVEFTIEDRADKLASISLTDDDAEWTYSWSSALPAELELQNYTFTETREKNTYTVTWKNGEDVLETDLAVPYGTTPSFNTSIPTKATTSQYVYTFSGWSPDVSSITGDTVYTAEFGREINPAKKGNYYTLSELGGTDGNIVADGNKVLTLKNEKEGTVIFKMTKIGFTHPQTHSFTLFYDGALNEYGNPDGTNGVRMTFEINNNLTINGTSVIMGNVMPNVEYYYLISYKVADDYSKVTVRVRVETEDATEVAAGRGVLGDQTIELDSLIGADSIGIEDWVKSNKKLLIDAQHCSFSVASAWTPDDDYAAEFVDLYNIGYTGNETISGINEAVQDLDSISTSFGVGMIVNDLKTAALDRSKELLQKGYFGVYTNEDVNLAAGGVAQWTSSIGDMPNKTSGSIIFNFTVDVVTNDAQRFIWINLFEEPVYNDGAGVYYPYEERGLINDDADLFDKVTAGTTYTVMISYKVASNYSSVVVNYRLVDASTGALVYTLTKTFTSVVRSDTSLADWIASHNKFSVGSGAYSYTISTPWTWSASVCDKFNSLYERQEDLVAGETLKKAQTLLEDFDVVYRVAFRSNSFDTIEASGGYWTSQEGYMPNKTCGTIKINFRLDVIGADDQRYIWINLFEEKVGLPYEGLGLINGDDDLRGIATTGPAYTAVISYKVASDYSSVVVNYRLLSSADDNVVVNLTKTFTSVVRSEANLEGWIAGHNMFYFGAGAYSYSVASA